MDISQQKKERYWELKGVSLDLTRCARDAKSTFYIIFWLTVVQTNVLAQIFWQQTSGNESTHVKSIVTIISAYYFAGTDGEGIYRSMDNGFTWRKINDSLIIKKNIQALGVDSNRIIFAGTKENGVFSSSNYGNSWQDVTNNLAYPYINSLVITLTNSILVGTDRGIFRSNNNGDSWKKILNDTLDYSKVYAIAINKKNGHIFAGIKEWGMFKSIDDGLNWKLASMDLLSYDVISISFNKSDHIFAGTSNGAYRSIDDGEHWIKVTDLIVNAFAPNRSNHIFAATRNGVFRSTNNGDTWKKFSSGLPDYSILTITTDTSGTLFARTAGEGVYRAKDAALPIIIHSPQTFAYNQQEIPIELQATDDTGIEETTLFVRPGGDVNFMSLSMSGTDSSYTCNIPSEFVTDRGVEYYITTSDSFDNVTRLPNKSYFSVQVIVGEPGAKTENPQIAGSDKTAYRLVSVPLDLENKTAKALLADNLGQYDNKKWRFYELPDDYFEKPDSIPTYREYNDELEIESGKAYWLIVKEEGKYIDTGPGKTFLTDREYEIVLHQEWNFIGNPFNFSLPISNFQLKNRKDTLEFKRYTGEWKTITAYDTLHPFDGLAFFAESTDSDTLIINPDLTDTSSAYPNYATSLIHYNIISSIRIVAQCQQARDGDNLAVIASDALIGKDRRDQPEPPVIGKYVSVYFPHRDWNSLAKTYCTDARPEPTDGEIWEFEVKTNIHDKVDLSFEGLESVPVEFEVWLLDEAVKITRDLRQTNYYSIAGRGELHPKQLKLVIGKQDFVQEKLLEFQVIPEDYALSQNFPNPFNPATTIRYGLPGAENVTLKVYNLLGEEIVTLVDDEQKEAGYHVAIWDGRNKNGSIVASGVYFYHLYSDNFSMKKKMLLVK